MMTLKCLSVPGGTACHSLSQITDSFFGCKAIAHLIKIAIDSG